MAHPGCNHGKQWDAFCFDCDYDLHALRRARKERDMEKPAAPKPLRLDLSLVPGFFIRALAAPFMVGAAKYARGDWKTLVTTPEEADMTCRRRLTSLMNHLTLYLDGISYDSEGAHHLAAVAWNALYILFLQDRFFSEPPFDQEVLQQTVESYEAKKGRK